ncbi:hypothetical protein Tco_0533831 [Tanacetum coccineum]
MVAHKSIAKKGEQKKTTSKADKPKKPTPAKQPTLAEQTKPVKEKTSKPTPSKKIHKGKVMKVHKVKRSGRLVDEEDKEPQPASKPQVEDDEYNLQRGIQMSKGKGIATDEQVVQSLLELQKPEKQNAETRADTENSNCEGDTKILNVDEERGENISNMVTLEERTVDLDEGQAGSDPSKTFESRPLPDLKLRRPQLGRLLTQEKLPQAPSSKRLPIKTRPDWLKHVPKEERPKTPESDWTIPPNDLPETKNNWATAIINAYKDLEENKLIEKTKDMRSFIKWYYKQIGKSKLSKADLEGLAFKLVRPFHKNNISLQFQMEECHLLLTHQIDLVNPEGNRVVPDMSKPLPLGGPLGQVIIQLQYFFNKDLEYLVSGDKERMNALSISKLKASYYPNFGLKELVPSLWIECERKYDISAAYNSSHWWF